MNRNVSIILVALAVAAGSIAGAASLVSPLNTQRRELELTYDPDVVENMSPGVAVLYAGLGSFRGMLINALWIRANTLKENGQFYEAMELSELITTIQPRFAEVWSFHSWNMAYNISVATHTPRERWMWVNRGIELLRDRGIPKNPMNTALYRQLGWTYLHKIGQYTDDMHWHYKQQLAWRWHLLLGEPPEGEVQRVGIDGQPRRDAAGEPIMEPAAVAAFRPIGAMDRRFFADDMLAIDVRRRLARLGERYPAYAERLNRLSHMDPAAFERHAGRLADAVESRYGGLIEALREMVEQTRGMRQRGVADDPVAAFTRAYPEAKRTVERLRAAGLELDRALLEGVGRVKLMLEGEAVGYELAASRDVDQRRVDAALRSWLTAGSPRDWLDSDSAVYRRMQRGGGVSDAELRAEVERVRDELVLPFLRAKVLREAFHMKPAFMLELMAGHWLVTAEQPEPRPLPMDWRHPASHALYWSALGVRVGHPRTVSDDDYYHTLNTDRQIIHALQQLTRSGRIVFDPFRDYYQMIPDPRYIEAYLRAVYGAEGRIAGRFAGDASQTPRSFQAGRENFLVYAVQQAYFWGDREQAERYYARLGRLYGSKNPRKADRYSQPLEQFIVDGFKENITSLDDALNTITGLIRQAFVQGYATGRMEVARQRIETAEQIYRYYEQEFRDSSAPKADVQHRMALSSGGIGDLVAVMLERLMTAPPGAGGPPLGVKERIWRSIPDTTADGRANPLKQRIWDRIRPALYDQVRAANRGNGGSDAGPPPEARFPAPPGMEQYRQAQRARQQADGSNNTGTSRGPDASQ